MIQCYECNEWKPGNVAPFAICDDCKFKASRALENEAARAHRLEKQRKKELTKLAEWNALSNKGETK